MRFFKEVYLWFKDIDIVTWNLFNFYIIWKSFKSENKLEIIGGNFYVIFLKIVNVWYLYILFFKDVE